MFSDATASLSTSNSRGVDIQVGNIDDKLGCTCYNCHHSTLRQDTNKNISEYVHQIMSLTFFAAVSKTLYIYLYDVIKIIIGYRIQYVFVHQLATPKRRSSEQPHHRPTMATSAQPVNNRRHQLACAAFS
jgi:hypothetical protein